MWKCCTCIALYPLQRTLDFFILHSVIQKLMVISYIWQKRGWNALAPPGPPTTTRCQGRWSVLSKDTTETVSQLKLVPGFESATHRLQNKLHCRPVFKRYQYWGTVPLTHTHLLCHHGGWWHLEWHQIAWSGCGTSWMGLELWLHLAAAVGYFPSRNMPLFGHSAFFWPAAGAGQSGETPADTGLSPCSDEKRYIAGNNLMRKKEKREKVRVLFRHWTW